MSWRNRQDRSPRMAGWIIGHNSTVISLPFRTLEHTVFVAGLIEGGRVSMAKEIPLAYQDILFLDELTESPWNFLRVLRQPLKVESVVRALIVPVAEYRCPVNDSRGHHVVGSEAFLFGGTL